MKRAFCAVNIHPVLFIWWKKFLERWKGHRSFVWGEGERFGFFPTFLRSELHLRRRAKEASETAAEGGYPVSVPSQLLTFTWSSCSSPEVMLLIGPWKRRLSQLLVSKYINCE